MEFPVQEELYIFILKEEYLFFLFVGNAHGHLEVLGWKEQHFFRSGLETFLSTCLQSGELFHRIYKRRTSLFESITEYSVHSQVDNY